MTTEKNTSPVREPYDAMGPVDAPNPPAARATLADVRPGGRVRLQQALPPEGYAGAWIRSAYGQPSSFTYWNMEVAYAAGWQAALSAQPSPGGQGELLEQVARFLDYSVGHDPWPNIRRVYGDAWWEPVRKMRDELRALAARQPTDFDDEELQFYREEALNLPNILIGAGVFSVDHEGDYKAAWANIMDAIERLAALQPVGATVKDSLTIAARQPVASNQPSGNSGELDVDGDRQPVGEPVAWQSMATCPRDGTAVLLRWGEDHVSPGWWCAAVSPIQNEDGTWPRETGGFPWAFFDMNDGVAFVNHAVDTEYGPTHWAPYVYPAAQAVDLAPDHRGMRVSYSGLLNQVRGGLNSNPELAEMVRQLHGHLNELGKRWYAGDRKVVDEFLQLYVIEDGARRALIDSQAVGK
ncbi:hypothetical protein ACS0OW_15920 [Stenotrophomonas maltophilia]|uniref:hypothetical protein n=1 Tax=Stenotrophomonas maltophilia TaxID=40324 RepID=UPI004036C549